MKANGQTNSIMPIMNVLGYVPYVIVAIWGAYMAIVPVTNLGLAVTGTMAFGMIITVHLCCHIGRNRQIYLG